MGLMPAQFTTTNLKRRKKPTKSKALIAAEEVHSKYLKDLNLAVKVCTHCGHAHEIRGNACRVCKNGKFRYGLTRPQMIEMLKAQNGQCFLCEKPIGLFEGPAGGVIDHEHETGSVRKILCGSCNTLVGALEVHPNSEKVVAYCNIRGLAQSGIRAGGLGPSGREFESHIPDQLPPTSDVIPGFCPKKPEMVYSGERKLLGIAAMHKSNLVPVFEAEDAKELARMRR